MVRNVEGPYAPSSLPLRREGVRAAWAPSARGPVLAVTSRETLVRQAIKAYN
jgi:hypothetical protein